MTIMNDALDAAHDALKALDRPELVTLAQYTAPGGSPIDAYVVVRRDNSEQPSGRLGQQHKGARILIDMRDVTDKPIAGSLVVVGAESFTIVTCDRGVRFWHCVATT